MSRNDPDPHYPSSSTPAPNSTPGTDSNAARQREYERSGCYPTEGKPFRMWALFGWLTALIVVLAGAAALLNFILLDT